MFRLRISKLVETNSREALAYIQAQAIVDSYPEIYTKLGNLTPNQVQEVGKKIEAYLKEGISLKEILEKKYQEIQKVLPTMAPKVKDLLLTDVTDVEGLKDNLQDITKTVTQNEKEDKEEYRYTRKNTRPAELTQLASQVVNVALTQYKKLVVSITEKSQRISLFLGLVEDEVIKILDDIEPLLRPAFNERVKGAARDITYSSIFTASGRFQAINENQIEDFSGAIEEEGEIRDIKTDKSKFLVTSPKDKGCDKKASETLQPQDLEILKESFEDGFVAESLDRILDQYIPLEDLYSRLEVLAANPTFWEDVTSAQFLAIKLLYNLVKEVPALDVNSNLDTSVIFWANQVGPILSKVVADRTPQS